MKKVMSVFIVLMLLLMICPIAVYAHPAVPEQSIGNVSENAANGMHTAWANIQKSKGVAQHVFLMRHLCHPLP
jgi:methionine-rich copper-binding protein CopC